MKDKKRLANMAAYIHFLCELRCYSDESMKVTTPLNLTRLKKYKIADRNSPIRSDFGSKRQLCIFLIRFGLYIQLTNEFKRIYLRNGVNTSTTNQKYVWFPNDQIKVTTIVNDMYDNCLRKFC